MAEELEFGMSEEPERVVHARWNGVEVARYDDEWYLEPIPLRAARSYYSDSGRVIEKENPLKEKKKVSMQEAAKAAAKGIRDAWNPKNRKEFGSSFQVYWDEEGGEEFDAIVESIFPELRPVIDYFSEGGHEYMGMRCPGCQEWMRIDNVQIRGDTCTDHSTYDGGCGFHGYLFGKNAGYICDLGDVFLKREAERNKSKKKEPAPKKVKV